MTVRLYKSTDASAPVLDGQSGSLLTVLDAILVNGYGSKTAAGWTIEYTAAGKRVYRMATGGGRTGFRMRVLDDASLTGGARDAVVRGAESASDVDTLVDPFPTVALVANSSCIWRKSPNASSTAIAWTALASDNWIWFFPNLTGTGSGSGQCPGYFFGDIYARLASDTTYHCGIYVGGNASVANTTYAFLQNGSDVPFVGANLGFYFARTFDGTIKSPQGFIMIAGESNSGGVVTSWPGKAASAPAYPGGADSKLEIYRPLVFDKYATSGAMGAKPIVRGCFEAIFLPWNTQTYTNMVGGDTFQASGYDAAADFYFHQDLIATATNEVAFVFQTAGTWQPPEWII